MKPIRNRSSRPATSRREFLGGVAAGAALAASSRAPSLGHPQDGEPQPPHAATAERLIELGANIAVFTGPIHVGVVRDGSRVLLIDCGDGRVVAALREQGLKVEQVLFTHHHRDQACGALALAAAGAKLRRPGGRTGVVRRCQRLLAGREASLAHLQSAPAPPHADRIDSRGGHGERRRCDRLGPGADCACLRLRVIPTDR